MCRRIICIYIYIYIYILYRLKFGPFKDILVAKIIVWGGGVHSILPKLWYVWWLLQHPSLLFWILKHGQSSMPSFSQYDFSLVICLHWPKKTISLDWSTHWMTFCNKQPCKNKLRPSDFSTVWSLRQASTAAFEQRNGWDWELRNCLVQNSEICTFIIQIVTSKQIHFWSILYPICLFPICVWVNLQTNWMIEQVQYNSISRHGSWMILEPICLDAEDARETKRETSEFQSILESHPGDVGFKKAAFFGAQWCERWLKKHH